MFIEPMKYISKFRETERAKCYNKGAENEIYLTKSSSNINQSSLLIRNY